MLVIADLQDAIALLIKIVIFVLLCNAFLFAHRGLVVVAFGDSITAGYGLASPSSNWAFLYASQRGMALDNRAVNGMTVSQEVDLMKKYNGEADEALWLVCANDLYFKTSPEDFKESIQEGVNILTSYGITVLLNSSCPTFPRNDNPELIEAYNTILSNVNNAKLIKLNPMPSSLFIDSVHPNEIGNQALAFSYLGHWKNWIPMIGE